METCVIETPSVRAEAGRTYQVASTLLLRVAGLPLSAAVPLHDRSGRALIEQSLSLASEIKARGESLSDLLHAAVREANGNSPVQHALLGLRRDIFNGRSPSAVHVQSSLPHLASPVQEAVAAWLQHKDELDRHSQLGEQHVQATLARHRRELQTVASLPDFRKGLLLSSPSFERALNDYGRADLTKPDRKLRRTERTLLSYLLRTVYKTSPFSTLTPVALLQLSDDPRAHDMPALHSRELVCAVKPNLGLLARLRQALVLHAVEHPTLRLQAVDSATITGKRVRYWKRTETPVRADGPVHSRVTETSFFLHLTPSLQVVMRVLEHAGEATVAELKEALTTALRLSEAEASEYIQLLVEHGFLLLACLRRSVFEADYWHSFAAVLRATSEPALHVVAEGVERINTNAQAFATVAPAERSGQLAAIEADAAELLGTLENAGPLPRPVLYEDARTQSVAVRREAWTEPMAALAELQRVLSIFDPFLVSRVTLKALFKKRYGIGGTCSDILAFSDFFQEAFYRPYQQATAEARRAMDQHNPFGRGTLNPLKLPEVTALANARTELASRLEQAIRAGGSAEEFVLELPLWVTDLGEEMVQRHGMLSNSFFFQIAQSEAGQRIVLNHVYGGFGCMFTRFAHLFPSAGHDSLEAALRSNLRNLQPDGVLFAEFQGGHDTNLNQHRLLAPAELVLPGECGISAPDKQVRLTELYLQHRPATDDVVLRCDRLGKRVVPLYLGMLYPLVLPELQTLLLHFAPPTVLRSAFSPKQLPRDRSVLHQPRIRYKNVILERARWTVALDAIPQRAHAEGDYGYFVRLAQWRREAGLPTAVFASLIPTAGAMEEEDGARPYAATAPQKPFYLSFDQPLAVLQFEKLLADSKGYLQFAEALPAPEDAVLHHGHDAFVAEFVADITQGSFA